MQTPSTVRFIGVDRMCPTTAAFSFTRPEGYTFRAGQYFRLTVSTPDGELVHSFSHADAPADDGIVVLTRLTDSTYKNALLAMSPGDEAKVSGPFGSLVVTPEMSNVSFLVGGVGVSPARGILRDAAKRDAATGFLVFDGNMDETCIPFKDEFDEIEARSDRIAFVHVLAEPDEAWSGERGFITADIVRRHCDPLDGRHWFVCGPPAMVDAMRIVTEELAIPNERLHFELFAGYQ
jgi:ferredoxin-NADP reductase